MIYQKDHIDVTLLDEENDLHIKNHPFKIIYEDEYILVIDKDYNLEIEPSRYNQENNLACYLSSYYLKKDIKSKIHFVNRLDKLTSGLVIAAKNQYIKNLFKQVEMTKRYHALVVGKLEDQGTINIGISKSNGSKRIVSEQGKKSITRYRLIESKDDSSLLDIEIPTGRTHQIRLSLAYIHHPLKNDPLYANKKDGEMYLRAYYLNFIHPITHQELEFTI